MRELVARKTLFGDPTSADVEVLASLAAIDKEEADHEAEILAQAEAIKRRRGKPKGTMIPL